MNIVHSVVLMGFVALLLFPLIVSVGFALVRIVIGIINQSIVQVAFGISHLSVLIPLAVTFRPGGLRSAIIVGELLLVVLVVALAVEWVVLRQTAEILLGIAGVLAFGVHVFLLVNSP
jgi:hypothetical protein